MPEENIVYIAFKVKIYTIMQRKPKPTICKGVPIGKNTQHLMQRKPHL